VTAAAGSNLSRIDWGMPARFAASRIFSVPTVMSPFGAVPNELPLDGSSASSSSTPSCWVRSTYAVLMDFWVARSRVTGPND
jgi:hypothetical protein